MIPIQNIYYLLLYAWNALEEGDVVAVGDEPLTQLVDLFGRVLSTGAAHLIRRGLDRGYIGRQEEIAGIRGKIDMAGTLKTAALSRARAVCEFDELSHNVIHNQIVKSAIRDLLAVRALDDDIRAALQDVYRRMPEVEEIRLCRRAFRSVQLHRNNRFYRFLLSVCQFVHNQLLVNETTGETEFRDFIRDERAMRRLFERFVRNFYRRHAEGYKAKVEKFRWQQTTGSRQDLQKLPVMITDTSLISERRRIVIETKYVPEALVEGAVGEGLKIRASHLYQLFAYLQNLAARYPECGCEGILLYPWTSSKVDLRFSIHAHSVRVYALDLNQHWPAIERDLVSLISTRDDLTENEIRLVGR